MGNGRNRILAALFACALTFGLAPALAFAEDAPGAGDPGNGAETAPDASGADLTPADPGTGEGAGEGDNGGAGESAGEGEDGAAGAGTGEGESEEPFEYTGPTVAIHRLVDPYTCQHLYTPSSEEAEAAEQDGWTSQGVAWHAPETSDTPAYRLYNPYTGEHFYTAGAEERDNLVSVGWEDEGIGFYSLADEGIPIYRLYNSFNGDHHFTASGQEREDLVAVGWTDEDVKFFGAKPGDAYSGAPDWAEVVVEDEATGVVAEGMVFALQALEGNSVQLQVGNVQKGDAARYYELRNQYSLTRTYAFSVYDVKLVLKKADGTTEEMKSGFGDVKLTFPVDAKYNGKMTRITHLGTRSNGEEYTISRKTGTVEDGATSVSVTHFSEFIVAVGEAGSTEVKAPEAKPADNASGEASGEAEAEKAPAVLEMHRLYNPHSGEHFYTASAEERDAVVEAGWTYEGVGWLAPEESNFPVYRLYSGTDHHYTMSAEERDAVVEAGWTYEGVGWYSDDGEGVPLLRQYNPYVQPDAPANNAGAHNYTTSVEENDSLVQAGWIAEGIGWYGVRQDKDA